MNIAEIQKSTEQKMQKSVEALKHDFAKVRTGRAHVGLLDHIQVDYYGSMMPMNQVAKVGLGDARTITIQPWEKKMIPVVEKAIRESDLGLNPATSWRHRARTDAAADRAASQGAGEGGQARRRKRQGGGAKSAP